MLVCVVWLSIRSVCATEQEHKLYRETALAMSRQVPKGIEVEHT